MKSKFITLKLGLKKNKNDGLLISLSKERITELIITIKKDDDEHVIISKHNNTT